MSFEIFISSKALKFIEKLTDKRKTLIYEKLDTLKDFPDLNMDIKKMKGMDNVYRIRIGKIRILFDLDKKDSAITIISIDFRGNIY